MGRGKSMYENLLPRFLSYVKTQTRSNPKSDTIPSTKTQVDFAMELKEELHMIGLSEIYYNEENGYLTALLPSNSEKTVPAIGFIAHMDTADFNADGVSPKIVENYDGHSDICLDEEGAFQLTVKEFPNLKNYQGETLITTDGTTLLGSDDKSGIAEIMTAMEYFIEHPEVKHGDVYLAFGPDEEIGTGADHFDVEKFPVDFAYTMDGGPLGELEYETFNAAEVNLTIQGKNVHPGTAKNIMVNALQVAIDYHNMLPAEEVPEKTEGYEGFYHLCELNGTPDEATMQYIIRDHDKKTFETRKQLMKENQDQLNKTLGAERISLEMHDEYYNMGEIIKKDFHIIELAKEAMEDLGITPIIEPVRGGTDGSKISFMGIPTPNIFAGAENMHGRYEFVSLQTMEKAVSVIIRICERNEKHL